MFSFLRGKGKDKLAAQVEAAVVAQVGVDFEMFLTEVASPAFTDKFRRLVALISEGGEDTADAYETFRTEIVDLNEALIVFAEQRIRTAIEGMEVIGKGDNFRTQLREAITMLADGALESGVQHLGLRVQTAG